MGWIHGNGLNEDLTKNGTIGHLCKFDNAANVSSDQSQHSDEDKLGCIHYTQFNCTTIWKTIKVCKGNEGNFTWRQIVVCVLAHDNATKEDGHDSYI